MGYLKGVSLAVIGVCVFFIAATTARADTFVLTGGRGATGGTILSLFLTGPNFQFETDALAQTLAPALQGCPGPSGQCTTGATFSLNSSVPATAFTFGAPGSLVVNGTSYPPFRFNSGSVNWMGSAIVPTTTDRGEIVFSMPFTMSGTMVGTNIVGNLFIPPDPAETVIFSLSFEAAGTALVFLDQFNRPNFVNFQMTSGSVQFDPVPEPATILLLSAGLAGWSVLRRRRR
ncbi:MAG TPA: PEP-CTERM sorting domain-containing protein [Pyrinomonadaceae bacterium]|nr:PEP-CTERM sorting domain-containing protein [Pyrinomonadaceae bacterium]